MPTQDLTPQLRTRLSRAERWVGIFLLLATLLLVVGLVYYLRQLAVRRGWFVQTAPYHTYLESATGLRVGDPVRLMGFDVGEITSIESMRPKVEEWRIGLDVYVQFRIKEPYYHYLWTDSKVNVMNKGLLGDRYLEVVRGYTGTNTVLPASDKPIIGVLDPALKVKIDEGLATIDKTNYLALTVNPKGYWLDADESSALNQRVELALETIRAALPSILSLTNDFKRAITNVASVAQHTDQLILSAQPVVTNLREITANLRRPDGALGQWLLPAQLQSQIDQTLDTANSTMVTAENNLQLLTSNLVVGLQNLAALTSNLNSQVQANQFILSDISSLIIHADETVQGLKRHWLLKGAFEPDQPPQPPTPNVRPRLADPP